MNQDLNQELRRERWETEIEAREKCEGAHEEGGREGNACQETIVFLVFNIDQANVKSLIG